MSELIGLFGVDGESKNEEDEYLSMPRPWLQNQHRPLGALLSLCPVHNPYIPAGP
jgi:hypothetical protein